MRSLLFLFLWLVDVRADPKLCAGRNATSQPVIDFCSEHNGNLTLRCCFSADFKTILAVDMFDLDLVSVPDFTHYADLDVRVLDLRGNPQLEPKNSSDFLTLTTLNELFLPEQFDCPGGTRVWQTMNKTTEPAGNLCLQQIDFCANSSHTCVEPRSSCSVNGPNHFLCLCKADYHGYKCLRQGKFPATVFLGSTAGVTVVASALLYWTQRRHVRK